MNISHLSHTANGVIRCTCGDEFEVKRWQLSDPELLIERKEQIAGMHKCNLKPRREERPQDRVWQAPTTGAQLAHYYSQAMRRMSA